MAISEQNGVIRYRSEFAAWARVFVGLIGIALALCGPATMISIAAPAWSLSFALSVFTGVALLLFGLFALTVSLSAAMTLDFRLSDHVLVVSTRGPLTRSRTEYDFAAVSGPTLTMRDSEDGPYPVLGMTVRGRRSGLEMTGFASAEEARLWQKRIADIIAKTG